MRTTQKRFFQKKHLYISLAIAGFLLFSVILNNILSPSASELQTVTSQVSVGFCTEGETAPVCDATQNVFTGEATSNVVSLDLTLQTISDRMLCIQGEAEVPLLTHLEGSLKVSRNGSTLFEKSSVKSDNTGRINLELRANDLWAEPTQVTFKPKGYFARTITSNAFDPTTCIAFSGENKLIRGDFDNDGQLSFDDVSLIIKAYRGTPLESTVHVFGNTTPNFGDVLDIIKKYRQRDNYHDA